MRWTRLLLPVLILVLWSSASMPQRASGGSPPEGPGSIGPGHGVLLPDAGREHCGTLVMNSDGPYPDAYCWSYGGLAPPDFGSFAECYAGRVAVCGVVLDLTQIGDYMTKYADVFLWEDNGGRPGSVLCARQHAPLGTIAFWPSVSRHLVEFPSPCCTSETWWVGFWGNWPGGFCRFYVGADLDGPGGCPMTNIAPGQGYPTGWQDVSVVWGTTSAVGIGAETVPCPPVPTRRTSWGAVKALYR